MRSFLSAMSNQDAGRPSSPDADRGVRSLGLERVPVRMRESRVTTSAWCLAVHTARGDGRITRLEAPDGSTIYRGEGVFLGASADELEVAYRCALPPAPPPDPDPGQFG
jgi:hypothetical protein